MRCSEGQRLPKIRFAELPRDLWQHLAERVAERQVSMADLLRLQASVRCDPFAPDGDWFKDFGSFKLCGSGEYPRTVLTREMKAFGTGIG